jgi:hypothetical protein
MANFRDGILYKFSAIIVAILMPFAVLGVVAWDNIRNIIKGGNK